MSKERAKRQVNLQDLETKAEELTPAQAEQAAGGCQNNLKQIGLGLHTSGDADDRPTEEVAFYYNRIG